MIILHDQTRIIDFGLSSEKKENGTLLKKIDNTELIYGDPKEISVTEIQDTVFPAEMNNGNISNFELINGEIKEKVNNV